MSGAATEPLHLAIDLGRLACKARAHRNQRCPGQYARLQFAAVTTDTVTGRAHLISEGSLLSALLASSAIPGIYPPVERNGLRLCDGGVVANVPMGFALEMGSRSMVVLDCFPVGCPPGPFETSAEVVLFTIVVAMRAQASCEASRVATDVPVVYLPCSTGRVISPLDFSLTDELIAGAYDTARPFLESLDVHGPGLYGVPGTQ